MKTIMMIVPLTFALFLGGGDASASALDAGVAAITPSSATPVAPEAVSVDTPVKEAAPVTADEVGVVESATGAYKSIKGGQWILALGFMGMLFGSCGRWLVGKKWAFIHTKAGGYVIAGATGAGILGAGIVGTGSMSMELIPIAVAATLAAMGLHGPAQGVKNKLATRKAAPVTAPAE